MKRILPILLCTACAVAQIHSAEILSETFSYADGPLVSGSGGVWATHSGTADQASITAGRLRLSESSTEDVNGVLPGQPYSSGSLYASFSVTFEQLPSGDGTFFAHFKDGGNGFRARVFATTVNAAEGGLRLGVGNGSASTPATVVPVDLALNQSYTVVLRYDLEAGVSTLWVDPLDESDIGAGIVATDSATAINVGAFAFRQSRSSGHGMGTVLVDDLRVGTSFSSVTPVPEPSTWALGIGGACLLLLARRRRTRPSTRTTEA